MKVRNLPYPFLRGQPLKFLLGCTMVAASTTGLLETSKFKTPTLYFIFHTLSTTIKFIIDVLLQEKNQFFLIIKKIGELENSLGDQY